MVTSFCVFAPLRESLFESSPKSVVFLNIRLNNPDSSEGVVIDVQIG